MPKVSTLIQGAVDRINDAKTKKAQDALVATQLELERAKKVVIALEAKMTRLLDTEIDEFDPSDYVF